MRLIDRPVQLTLFRALGAAVDAVDARVLGDALTAGPRAAAGAAASALGLSDGGESTTSRGGQARKGRLNSA